MQDIDSYIEKYITANARATRLLHENDLFGHMLILMYSTIDSAGLLDAAPSMKKATGQTFKDWAKKYVLGSGEFDFDEEDLWGARCGVLHSYGTASKLSDEGRVKQIQYYHGPMDSPGAKAFVATVKQLPGDVHVPAHLDSLLIAFLRGLASFARDLSVKCKADPAVEQRVQNVLQNFVLPA